MPRAPRARDPAASASQEQGSSLSLRRDGRSSDAEDGPAEDAPAEPLRQQQHREAPGAGLEAAPAGAPLARACDDYDDYDDCDDCDDELDTAAAGAPQARLLGAA